MHHACREVLKISYVARISHVLTRVGVVEGVTIREAYAAPLLRAPPVFYVRVTRSGKKRYLLEREGLSAIKRY